jgi:hypothetical protein
LWFHSWSLLTVSRFWKEEVAGEEYNYIHNTGWYEDKDARTVFEDVIDDVKSKTQNSKYSSFSLLQIVMRICRVPKPGNGGFQTK